MTDGGTLQLESGVPSATAEVLRQRGHRIMHGEGGFFGGYQAIQWDPVHRVYHGASEMRKDGLVIGY